MYKNSLSDLRMLSQFCQVYRNLMDSFADPSSLPRAQASVLSSLVRRDGITQSELGNELCVQGATVTNMLQRLEESGYIVRHRDAEDNRLVRVYLTETGREKGKEIDEQFGRLDALLFGAFNAEERQQFLTLLARLLDAMSHITP